MAGYRALGVLLAAAALMATAARAADDDHMYHSNCFKSCTDKCDDDDKAAENGGLHLGAGNDHNTAVVSAGGGVSRRCEARCLDDCVEPEDLAAVCYLRCAFTTCHYFPPYSIGKFLCMQSCSGHCMQVGAPPPPPPPPPPPALMRHRDFHTS